MLKNRTSPDSKRYLNVIFPKTPNLSLSLNIRNNITPYTVVVIIKGNRTDILSMKKRYQERKRPPPKMKKSPINQLL